MDPLFPPWANGVVRGGILGLVLLVLGIPLVLMGWVRTPYARGMYRAPEQPIPFDHRHHVVDDGIDCRYCHTTVETAASAGYPSSELCMNCHSQIWNDSPLLEPVRASYDADRPLRWVRVHRLPDFVFFDHSAHVANGVGCETCHGRVDTMGRIHQAAPLTMGWCLDCHRRPAPHLRPRGEITTMGWRGGAEAPGEEQLAEIYDADPGTDCTTCHR